MPVSALRRWRARGPWEMQTAAAEQVCGVIPADAWVYLRDSLRLSDRELRVVQGICANEAQETTALALDVSSTVVYRTIQRVYVKLRIGSRLELKTLVASELLSFTADPPQTNVTCHAGSA